MSKKYLLTQEGLLKLNEELKHLITDKRKEVIERIREAAAHGDLSENADYAQAREEQSFIEGRIMEIEDMIKNANDRASYIIERADDQAKKLIGDANNEVLNIIKKHEDAKHALQTFNMKFKVLVENQLRVLDESLE